VLEYGVCEEYYVDVSERELFFQTQSDDGEASMGRGESSCVLPQEASPEHHTDMLAAVVWQPSDSETRCVVQTVPLELHHLKNGDTAAEIVAIDAFTQASMQLRGAKNQPKQNKSKLKIKEAFDKQLLGEEQAEEMEEDLEDLPPLDTGAVLRLEDPVEPYSITSEHVASRTLGFGNTYVAEPGNFHMILEDVRGTNLFDKKDVLLEGGHAYVALRLGHRGSEAFPERLVVHACQKRLQESKAGV